MPQLGSDRKFLTKSPPKFPTWDPAETFWPKCLRHHQARFHSKISQQTPISPPELIPIHSPSKISSHAPRSTLLPFHTKRTSFHTPNLTPILLSQPGSFHSPHPESVSPMGYTRPPSRPHESHYTRRLDPTSGSSPGCQSRIHSRIQPCAGVNKWLLHPPTLV